MPRRRRRRKSNKQKEKVVVGGAYTQNEGKALLKEYDEKWGGTPVVADPPKSTVTYTGGYGGGYGWSRRCGHWREPVTLQDGITLTVSAWFDKPTKEVSPVTPEIGVYFDTRWIENDTYATKGWRGPQVGSKNQLCIVAWPDYGVPRDFHTTVKVLEYALNKAAEGRHVDIGCLGAHGRTGTALAAMQVLLGVEPDEAMEWVWQKYCWNAIESKGQEQWVRRVWNSVHKHPPTGIRVLDLPEQEQKKEEILTGSGWVTTVDQGDVTPEGQALLNTMLENDEITVEQWCEWTGLSPENLPEKIQEREEQQDEDWLKNLYQEFQKEQKKWNGWCEYCDQAEDYCYCVYRGYI